MGLHSPFGYVDREVEMAELLIAVLNRLCKGCHTNADYDQGCRGCPAGGLFFACKEYILMAEEGDKHHAVYASEEHLQRQRERGLSEEQLQARREMALRLAADYEPECDAVRAMKAQLVEIESCPYLQRRHEPIEGRMYSQELREFKALVAGYKRLKADRLRKWGLPVL